MPRNKYKKGKNGLYQTKVQMGINPDTGERVRKTIYAKSSSELEIKKLKYDENYKILQNEYFVERNLNITMEALSKSWFNTYHSCSEFNTKAMYRYAIEHINKEIGHKPVSKISFDDIQNIINIHFDTPSECTKIVLTAHQIFEYAYEKDIIKKNPCNKKKLRLPKIISSPKRALLKEEKEAILKANFTNKEKYLVSILYYFGLRPEEIKALMPCDFDFKDNTLTVARAAIYNADSKKMEIKDVKTESGLRTLPIPAPVKDFLSEYVSLINTSGCKYCLHKIDDKTAVITNSGYNALFNQIVKKIQDYNNINIADYLDSETYNKLVMTKRAQKKPLFYNVNNLTSYTFRRNYATVLYYSSISLKKAAQLMGHSNTKMILKIYAQLDDEKENAASKLDSIFSD